MPRAAKSSLRCEFEYKDGRRCAEERATATSYFCPSHMRYFGLDDLMCTLQDILKPDEKLESAADVFRVLGNVLRQLAANRISPRRAAVLGYVAQLMVNCVPHMMRQASTAAGAQAAVHPRNGKKPAHSPELKTPEEQDAEAYSNLLDALAETVVDAEMKQLVGQWESDARAARGEPQDPNFHPRPHPEFSAARRYKNPFLDSSVLSQAEEVLKTGDLGALRAETVPTTPEKKSVESANAD